MSRRTHGSGVKSRAPEHMQTESWLEVRPGAILVHVRVQPRARAREVCGHIDGRLRMRVTEPPADGRANAAVVALLARLAGVARSTVVVSRGARGREKTLTISTGDPAAIATRLRGAVGEPGTGAGYPRHGARVRIDKPLRRA